MKIKMNIENKKRCCSCKAIKPLESFNKNRSKKDWLKAECRYCQAISRNKYKSSDEWKEVMRLERHRRRARKLWCDILPITKADIAKLLEEQEWKCNICNCDITDRTKRELDHIFPMSKWWAHSLENVQWLCKKCNIKKGDNF